MPLKPCPKSSRLGGVNIDDFLIHDDAPMTVVTNKKRLAAPQHSKYFCAAQQSMAFHPSPRDTPSI
ncbi:MAG: hypothetical protein GY792_02585 [Gammaproteobacteria bacterium]|nr:hypothetical protein [Gammaproteobacteria bacterium]